MNTTTNTALQGWDPFDQYRQRDPRARDLDLFFEQVNRPHKLRNPKNIQQAELRRRKAQAIEAQATKAELEEINTRTMDILLGVLLGGLASLIACGIGLISVMM